MKVEEVVVDSDCNVSEVGALEQSGQTVISFDGNVICRVDTLSPPITAHEEERYDDHTAPEDCTNIAHTVDLLDLKSSHSDIGVN